MKTIKRALTLVLTLAVLLAGFTFPEFQAEAKAEAAAPEGISGTNDVGTRPEKLLRSGEWLYYLDGDEAIVAGYANKDEEALTIPFSLNKHRVHGIGSNAFDEMRRLRSVSIHSYVNRVASDAFSGADVTVSVCGGSYALKYAKTHGLAFKNLTNNENYDFNASVIDFSGFSKRDYSVGANNNILVSDEIATLLHVGDIVYLPDKSTELHLFAYRIASIDEKNGRHVLRTENVSEYAGFLDRLCFQDQQLEMDTDNIVLLSDGVTVDGVSSSYSFSSGFEKTMSVSVSGPLVAKKGKGSLGLKLTGQIYTTLSGKASIEINTFPIPSVKTANVTFSKSLGYKVSLTGSASASETKVNLFKVPVRGGPFSFWFTVQLCVSLSGSITVSGGITGSLSLIKERGKDWRIVPKFESQEPRVELSVKIEVTLPFEVSMELGIKIGSAGLALKFASIKLTPGLDATGKTNIDYETVLQCIDVTASLNITLSLSVGVLKVTFGTKEWSDLVKKEFSKKMTLLSYSFHLDQTAPGIHYVMVDHCQVVDRKVVFRKGNGENDYVTKSKAGRWIVPPDAPKKEGLVFDGWIFSPSQSGRPGKDFKWNFDAHRRLPYLNDPNASYVFYARWRKPGEKPSEYEDPEDVVIDDGGDSGWFPEPPRPVQVSSIELNRSDEVLHVDGPYRDKLQLSASVYPNNAADKSVTWSSSNPAVATVDQSGLVTAVAQNGDNHETIITCTSNMNPSVKAQCRVNVFEPIPVKSITLDRTDAQLWANEKENNTLQLKATVDPANATYTSVHWKSSNESVAWVDGWGKVTALSAGTATITCQSIKNQEVTATCKVTVHQHVRDIYVTAEREGLLPTETVQLSALCYPTNADNKNVKWTSSDDTVATVDARGVVTARKYGSATITAAATDGGGAKGAYGLTVERELTLTSQVENDKLYLEGENSVIIGYAFATQGSVRRMLERGYDLEWSLTNGENDVADAWLDVVPTTYTVGGKSYEIPSAVLYSGALHKAGNATYTLRCKAGSYTATVDLKATVSGDKLAKSVKLNPSTFKLSMNEVAHIPGAPVATDGGTVPKILSVNLKGDAYFRSYANLSYDDGGLCVWFAESGQYTADAVYQSANSSYTVPVTFEVRDADGVMHLPVTNVALSDSFVNLVVGDTCQLSATVQPADAYDRSVTWVSEDTSIATVSKNGKVTARKRGMVYIRCEANDGSGCYDSCVLNIEPFMALNETAIEKTIYMNGQTQVAIESCSLTYQSAIRIEDAGFTPNWKLRRVSGDATEIALNEFTSTADGNVRIDGQEIRLLRANHTGTDRYVLSCEAGEYSASCDIVLKVVEGKSLPDSIALKKDSYTAAIDEEIEIETGVTCAPGGSKLPDDVNITLEPTKAFWNAMKEDTYFADFHCTFAEAGEYTAELVYSGANYRYAVPITVRVKDAKGNVPKAVQDIVMNRESVQLLAGGSAQLSASVLPADADYGSITWSSFDTSIATVSSNGRVTAVDAGTTYVIASSTKVDRSAVCLVTVEDGLTLESESLTKTIFVDGTTRTVLDTVSLTEASSKRLKAAPEWKLQRVSGKNLTLRCAGTETANDSGSTLYGCNIILYSASAVGKTVYDLVCSSGKEQAKMRIVVNAVARDGNAPASIELSQTSYKAGIDELIVVNPKITCWPKGTELPEGTRVDFVGDRQFLEAINQQDWFISQSISTFSFKEAGRYEANCVYSYANISYTIPVTFYIKDSSGRVPVHGTRMTLSASSLQMVAGEESSLEAVFTPSDVTNSGVTWKSSDTAVATVDANGRVKAKANGSAQITCTPADEHCATATCYVTVEDYLTVKTGNTSYSCYLEGEQENVLSSAWLSEGTKQRLNRDNIVPEWTLTTTGGKSATVAGKPDKDGAAIRVSTIGLKSEGTTEYRIICKAGKHKWSQDYKVVVNAAGVKAPKTVTLATTQVDLSVGKSRTIDFTPVCKPKGSALPEGVVSTYAGIGGFYDALDRSVYKRNGDKVTVAFNAPGRYLLARTYKARNLNYTALCVINVDSGAKDGFGLLETTDQECTVFQNARSGAVARISIVDAMVYERYGRELQWNLERVSGKSVTAGLIPEADTATLVVGDTEKTGTDVWRVSCSFGGITDYVDIKINVRKAMKPIPTSIELSRQRVTGVTGDWLQLPLGVKCTPAGSALPDTGDEFWSFEMMGGLAEDVSESKIENGMLAVCFSESGYYSGTLTYAAGTVSFELPVYFTISDEEDRVDKPDQLKTWILSDTNTVYPEGDTGVPIATAVVAENLNSYYAGTAPSYAAEKGITWSVSIKSGDAVTLGIRSRTVNTAEILLKSIKKSGDVKYTVSGKLDGKTYTGTGTLHVATAKEKRPDVTLIKSRYQVTQGFPVEISRMLYRRSDGGALQAAAEWNVGDALAAIGYSYETTDDAWKATFYKAGEYDTTVSAYVGNLKYKLPLRITVVGGRTEESLRTLRLPSALTTIEEQAFSGLTAQVVDLRGTKIKTIGRGAFKNCVDLVAVYIPKTVTKIADDAFYGCLNVTIHCVKGSGADKYAKSKGLNISYDMK